MEETPKQTNKNLKEALFSKIESENVCPRSKVFFRSREMLVWALWAMSVLVGALSVAVSLYVVTHRQYELYEATHSNFLTFAIEALPYLWLLMFGIMVFSAVYNLRHTKGGYRYPTSYIITSSIVLSFAGGALLQLFGFGYTVDDMLGKNMPMYTSQEKFEQKMWQAPEDGRLLGKQVMLTVAPTSTIIFEDINGKRWTLNISELSARDMDLLAQKDMVKLLGLNLNQDLKIFHACGAFPWMIEKGVTRDEMAKTRLMFEERFYDLLNEAEEMGVIDKRDDLERNEKICPKLAVVKRMRPPAQ